MKDQRLYILTVNQSVSRAIKLSFALSVSHGLAIISCPLAYADGLTSEDLFLALTQFSVPALSLIWHDTSRL